MTVCCSMWVCRLGLRNELLRELFDDELVGGELQRVSLSYDMSFSGSCVMMGCST